MELTRALLNKQVDERIDGFFAIERELRALLDRRLRSTGLTYAQCAMLRFIAQPKGIAASRESGAVHAADVVRYFGFAPRTVTVAVNALVKAKVLRRRRSSTDKRVQTLILTVEGQNALELANREYLRTAQLFGKLPRSHWNALWYTIPSILLGIEAENKLDARRERNR